MSGWWLASYVVLWALVAALALAVLALARQLGTLHLRLGPRGALEMDEEGPPLGEAPEPLDVHDVEGRPVTLGGPGEPQFLLFVSPECPVCRDVLPSVRVVAGGGAMRPYVVSDAAPGHGAAGIPERTPAGVPLVAAPEAARAYGVPGTPYAVALDATGVVRAKGTINNLEQMEGLVDTARRRVREPLAETGP